MPRKYPAEVRRQVIELARSGTKVAQLAETFGMSDPSLPTSRETRMIRELLNPEGVNGARDFVDQLRRSRRPRNGASRRREK